VAWPYLDSLGFRDNGGIGLNHTWMGQGLR